MVHARGYGYVDIENEVPATAETIYVIASITKLLTAATVMRLVEARRLRLDDDLISLLPDFPNLEQGRRITLSTPMTHARTPGYLKAGLHAPCWNSGRLESASVLSL